MYFIEIENKSRYILIVKFNSLNKHMFYSGRNDFAANNLCMKSFNFNNQDYIEWYSTHKILNATILNNSVSLLKIIAIKYVRKKKKDFMKIWKTYSLKKHKRRTAWIFFTSSDFKVEN